MAARLRPIHFLIYVLINSMIGTPADTVLVAWPILLSVARPPSKLHSTVETSKCSRPKSKLQALNIPCLTYVGSLGAALGT